jgi:hypothetical protein
MLYYWENPTGTHPDHGTIEAETDDEAIALMPKTAICLYHESDTTDGTPFVMVFEKPNVDSVVRCDGNAKVDRLCESCRFMQAEFPTMEDPLACPFCLKGHWKGYIVEAPPEDDPWKDCSDFQANT